MRRRSLELTLIHAHMHIHTTPPPPRPRIEPAWASMRSSKVLGLLGFPVIFSFLSIWESLRDGKGNGANWIDDQGGLG